MVSWRHILNPSYLTYATNQFDRAQPETESALRNLMKTDKLIKVDLEISLVYLRIAEMAQQSGDLDKSIDHLNRAIRFNPLSESANRNLGSIHFHKTLNFPGRRPGYWKPT